MQFINNRSQYKCINNREHRASTRQATEQLSRQAKPKQRPSGQSTCSCCTLIGQRLSLFVQRQQREGERERESNESKRARACRTKRIALSLNSPKRVTMYGWKLVCDTLYCDVGCSCFVRQVVCEATRLDSVVVRRSLCAGEAYTQRRSVALTVPHARYENSVRKLFAYRFPNSNAHTNANPSQAVKILIPLPFQDSIKTATPSKR